MTTENDELRELMAEEKARGTRRPKDPEIKRQERELLWRFRKALDLEHESDFIEAIRELGFAENPERLRNALRIWRASKRA